MARRSGATMYRSVPCPYQLVIALLDCATIHRPSVAAIPRNHSRILDFNLLHPADALFFRKHFLPSVESSFAKQVEPLPEAPDPSYDPTPQAHQVRSSLGLKTGGTVQRRSAGRHH